MPSKIENGYLVVTIKKTVQFTHKPANILYNERTLL